MKVTIDLPETLSNQFRDRRISDKEINAVVLAALEVWLAQQSPNPNEAGHFSSSAVPFVRQLIAQNRELFELLAKR